MKVSSLNYNLQNQTGQSYNNKKQNTPAFKGKAWVAICKDKTETNPRLSEKVLETFTSALEEVFKEAQIVFTRVGQHVIVPSESDKKAKAIISAAEILNPLRTFLEFCFE